MGYDVKCVPPLLFLSLLNELKNVFSLLLQIRVSNINAALKKVGFFTVVRLG